MAITNYKNITWIKGDIYKTTIRKLYDCIDTIQDEYYYNWKSHFIYIHGELDTQRKINEKKIEETFNITISNDREDLFKLIYCLETYYSIILRILAYKSVFQGKTFSLDVFRDETYKTQGITNYTCIDYYNWFLQISEINLFLEHLYDSISFADIRIEGDYISIVFEQIFPKEIRHSIGEYYTPYWLANVVIEQLTKDDEQAHLKKYIDPACGSATFIVALINKYKTLSKNAIFSNVCGIDINPLTVLAAKTNFLLLFYEESHNNADNKLVIPIYCADTIAINDQNLSLFNEPNDYDSVPNIKYDYIVGNPPWVNWEYLPTSYRVKHAWLWRYYGLFTQKGLNASFIKEDISVLFTYVVIDNYLEKGGKIGFVVKETLFKSIKQGEGFRKFKIIPKNIELEVLRVDDLTQIKPFKGAITRTAIIYMKKGDKTHYPVDYVVWESKSKTKTFEHYSSINLNEFINFNYLKARPSIKNEDCSGWITESDEEMNSSVSILGCNHFVARTGVFTGGANGVFWLNIISENNENVLVSNITERAKNKMKKIQLEIEKDFVFPFLTGNDLGFWSYSYSKYFICPHTPETKMYPVKIQELTKYPLTEKFFSVFKTELQERKGFTSMDRPILKQYYYTLQRIGAYTFAKYKVCWRYISKVFTPAVVEYAQDKYLGRKNIIVNEKIIFIGTDNRDEAYYLCGVLSSTPYRRTIENYMVGTQITPSIINRLYIPIFDSQNNQHLEISKLCYRGHHTKDPKELYIASIDKIIKTWLL